MQTLTPQHKSVDDQLKAIITPSGKSYYEVQRQKARLTAIILAVSAIFSLLFLLFSFVQKAAADTAREEAVKNEMMAHQQREQMEKISHELRRELAVCKESQGR